MSTPRIVWEKDNWFLNSHRGIKQQDGQGRAYQVDYRYAICYSLLNYLHPCKDGETEDVVQTLFDGHFREDGKTVLQQLQNAIGKKQHWQKEDFVEVIPFRCEGNGPSEEGCVIVDKADGMYPLVLYSAKKRWQGYQQALEDIIDLYEDHVLPFLKDQTVAKWNLQFQERMSEIPWNYAKEMDIPNAIGA